MCPGTQGLNGETQSYDVDEKAVPGFYVNYKVGQRVTVSCKRYPEIGYLVRSVRPVQ